MTTHHLVIRAGAAAAARLRDEGLHAGLFDTLVGASGGPKWLVLRSIDAVLIDRVIEGRSDPIAMVGSSIGSFRHACFAQCAPHAALERFTESYVEQAYSGRPTMEAISQESERILAHFLGASGSAEIAENDRVRSHVIAARLRKDRGHDRGLPFQLQLALAAARNAVSRRLLQKSFSRIVFHSGHEPTIGFRDFATQTTRLTPANVRLALLASGSIPMVMAGVRSLPGVDGTLFDGGIIDYHFDFNFHTSDPLENFDTFEDFERPPASAPAQEEDRARPPRGLILFPHFFDRVTPGWFDKPLRWRKPSADATDNVVMIAPSNDFVSKLPGGKVPDRNDFIDLETGQRIQRWRQVMDACRVLAEELNDLFDARSPAVSERIEPFAT